MRHELCWVWIRNGVTSNRLAIEAQADRMLDSPIDPQRLQEIYSRTAAFYDQVVAEHQAAAKELAIEMLKREAGERFLEVGLGTAWALVRIIRESGAERVFGIEAASGMLDVARERLRSEGTGLQELSLGGLRSLPFAAESFDCLLCTYTLEVLPQAVINQALSEMRRVMRCGGRLVVADLTEGEGEDAAIIEERIGSSATHATRSFLAVRGR